MARTAKTISLSLTADRYARLEALAKSKNVNPATCARKILVHAIDAIERSTNEPGCVSCNPTWRASLNRQRLVQKTHGGTSATSAKLPHYKTEDDLCAYYGCACACHLLQAIT